jgi:hypothetical protein
MLTYNSERNKASSELSVLNEYQGFWLANKTELVTICCQ